MIQRHTRMPFDLPPRDTTPREFVDVLVAAMDSLAKTTQETQIGNVITGCDGQPIVTVGDGSTCHDAAKPVSGGKQTLVANVGGQRIQVMAKLGRGMSASTGYQGHGLASGAIPAYGDRQASALTIAPVDNSTTLALAVGSPGEYGEAVVDMLGATISGKTGDAKRLAVCYGANGAGIWDDILTGSETAITGLSINPEYIAAQGNDLYALTKLYENTVSLVDAGAEASTTDLPVFTGTAHDFAFSAPALTRDRDTMAVLVQDNTAGKRGVYIGTSMLTSPSWAVLDLGSTYKFQVYGTRGLVFDDDDDLYVTAYTASTYLPTVLVIEPPYSAIATVISMSWASSAAAGQWSQPSPMAISRDGRYIACGAHGATGVLDIIKTNGRSLFSSKAVGGYTLTINSGNEAGYGGIAWGPDGRLFAMLRKTADGSYHLAVWDGVSDGTPEIIDLSIATTPLGDDWVSVSGDGQVVAVRSWTDEIALVEPPYTAAGATVTKKTMTSDISNQFEFDPSEAYQDASGLTLAVSVTSTTGSGSSITVVTRFDYTNTSGTAAFGVTIECPLPDGSTYVSSTDDGIYDAEASLVRWLLPSVAASASGYVELTTTTG